MRQPSKASGTRLFPLSFNLLTSHAVRLKHELKVHFELKSSCSQGCEAEPNVISRGVLWESPCEIVEKDHSHYAPSLRTRSAETQTEKEFKKTLSGGLTESTCNFYTGLGLSGFSKLVTSLSNKMLITADQVPLI